MGKVKHKGMVGLGLMVVLSSAFGQEVDIQVLEDRAAAACPTIWEDISADIDPAVVVGDHWQGDSADRDAFIDFISTEMGAAAPDATGLAAMADDLPTVAAECATQRLGLLDGLINKLPGDALAALSSVTEAMQGGASALVQDGFLVGDVRVTGRDQPAEGWLFLTGQTIGNTGSGANLEGEDFEALFALARNWAPNNGGEDFLSGDVVLLPDMRGRVIGGIDNMGGASADRITDLAADQVGGSIGAESHQLTVDELPSHSHGMGSAGKHKHSYTDVSTVSGSSLGSGGSRGDSSVTRNTSSTGSHTHSIQSTGGDQPHPIVQPTLFFNVEMKYK